MTQPRFHPHSRRPVALLCWLARGVAIAGAAAGAWAQNGRPTREDPPFTHPRPDPGAKPDRPAVKPIGPTSKPGTEPARPRVPDMQKGTIPGLENSDFKIVPAPLLAERSILTLRRGSVIRLPAGDLVMVFHPDQEGKADRPMVLLPCQKLQQLEHLLDNRTEPPVFLITGQVYAYQGINYLLPTAYSLVGTGASGESATAPGTGVDAAKGATSAPPTPPNTDQTVQDLIKQLEAQRRGPRTMERGPAVGLKAPAAEGSEADAEKTKALIPEGQTVVRRRGRMARAGSGDWEFVFDRGTGGDPGADRPMVLAPCLNLQRMEAYAATKGEAASFEVSGATRIYHGRNYLVPTLFQVYVPNDLEPRQ